MGIFGGQQMAGGGDGIQGPFVSWVAQEDLTWNIPPRCFAIVQHDLQDMKKKERVADKMMVDIYHIRTGWQWFNAQKRPAWSWAAAGDFTCGELPHWEKQYEKDKGWASGFLAPLLVGVSGGKKFRAIWSQSQRSAVQGVNQLMMELDKLPPDQIPEGQLPVIRVSDFEVIPARTSGQNPMAVPKFEICEWRPRPEELPDQDALGNTGAFTMGELPGSGGSQGQLPLSQQAAPSGPRGVMAGTASQHQGRPSPSALAAASEAQAPQPPQGEFIDDEIPF